MARSKLVSLLLLLVLLATRGQSQCLSDQIIDEPLDDGVLYIRYNQLPCSSIFWYPFCEDSGWGDEEATVVCRELGYSYGVSGFFEAFGGSVGYSSIDCDESESRLEECTIGEVDFDHYCSLVGVTQCFVPQVHILEPTEVVTGEGGQVMLCVVVGGSLREDVKIQVETGDDGSAIANFDYIILNTTLTFGPSHPEQQCVQIAIVDDSLAEGLEQFTVEFTATSSAVNVTNSTLKIFIEPNDFEFGNCTEGSVTAVSGGSSLQLVEMCSSEGVWSPVCDNNWTLQDATVVCRELKQGELDAGVLPGTHRGSLFPECLGNELRLIDCSTTPEENSTCSYVLVDCEPDSDTTGSTLPIDLWIIVSSGIFILIILILVIAVGICSIVYAIWRTVHKKKKSTTGSVTQTDGHSHGNGNTLSESHHTHQEDNSNGGTDDIGLNMDNPIYTNTTPDNHPGRLSDTPEHHLINPLYDEAEEPPLPPNNTPDNQSPPSCRISDTPEHNLINPLYAEPEETPPRYLTGEITLHITESIAEHQYAVPHDVTTTDSGKGNEAVRYHHYEYVDSPMTNVTTRNNISLTP